MSVPKPKRNLSELEFYYNAYIMRNEITNLLLRDFGVKDKVRNTKILCRIHKIEPQDEETLRKILEKYNMDNIIEEYPSWLIDKFRNSIMDCLTDIMKNIIAANTIYPVNIAEYNKRRLLQDTAIGNCEQLLQEMQYVIDIIPVDAQKYMRYVDMIEREIYLIKGWRKSDNKILKRIKNQEVAPVQQKS